MGLKDGESPKITISTCGGLEPLQMISKLDIERCAKEYTVPKWWIVRSHLSWEGNKEDNIS